VRKKVSKETSFIKHVDANPRGRVNVRFNAKRRTSRLRFTSVHEDQMETILYALKVSRAMAETEYDTVALELICMSYLACGTPRPRSSAGQAHKAKLQPVARRQPRRVRGTDAVNRASDGEET